MWAEVLVILLLMVGNGFFAASEIAVVSARRGRLEQQAEEGSRGAAVALRLADDPNRFLRKADADCRTHSFITNGFIVCRCAKRASLLLRRHPSLLRLGIVNTVFVGH
jgi:putative hemolysin